MSQPNRPLSPHITRFHFPLPAVLSVAHRGTGVALTAGTVALAVWLGAAAYGPASFGRVAAIFASPLGYLALFGWTVSLFFHLANGVRHLVWDVGHGYGVANVYRSAYAAMAVALVLTAAAWGWAAYLLWVPS